MSLIYILHHFQDIVAYFPNLEMSRDRDHANQSTKFKVSSFSHSRDILGGLKFLIGNDHNHAPFGVIYHPFGKT